MAPPPTANNNKGVNAFEWLAGGLFFGNNNNNNNNASSNSVPSPRRELQSIESSKDVKQLWTGVQDNWQQLLQASSRRQQQQQDDNNNTMEQPPDDDPDAIMTTSERSVHSTTTTTPHHKKPTLSSTTTDDLLSARLLRLRFLLYEERKQTMAAHNHSNNNNNASAGGGTSSTSLFGTLRSPRTPAAAVATVQYFAAQQQQQQRPSSSSSNDNNDNTNMWLSMISHMTELPFESRKVVAHIFCYLAVCGLDGADAHLYQDAVMVPFLQQVVVPDFARTMQTLVSGYHHDVVQQQQQRSATSSSNSATTTTTTAATTPPPPTTTTTSGTNTTDIALHFGSMFRALLRHYSFYQQLVGTTESVTQFVFPFLDDYVHSPNFDVASDAMESLKCIFLPQQLTASSSSSSSNTNQQQSNDSSSSPNNTDIDVTTYNNNMATAAAEFLTRDYTALWDDRFVPQLLCNHTAANNYMTKRVALQILSTVLLTRSNYNVMVQFVAAPKNAKVILILLRHTSPHITLDAFHVFKVFVANPHKPPAVVKMLKDNQVKLVTYLKGLHADKAAHDAQFRDEKALIIATIEAL